MHNNRESIKGICEDLYLITGIKAGVYDGWFQPLYVHPETMGPFCNAVRRNPDLRERCFGCDRRGFEMCRKSGEITIYRCHMGLTEVITPIAENGELSGYLMFGQLLIAGEKENVLSHLEGIDNRDLLVHEITKMPETEENKLRAAARLTAMCASYIHLTNILGPQHETQESQLRRYVHAHLCNPMLSIEMLCTTLGISRGTLYNLSIRAFGMGITQYIREQRIDQALEWIKTTRLPLHEIAERCAFSDADYLARLIRRRTGKSPRALRQQD